MPLVPAVDDPESAGFWDAARRHELVVRACRSCRAVLHLPRPCCDACGGSDLEWRVVPGEAVVYSWTITRRSPHPSYAAPYAVAIVELCAEPSVRFVTRLDGEPALAAGLPMEAWFEPVPGTDVVLPQWRPAPHSKPSPTQPNDRSTP